MKVSCVRILGIIGHVIVNWETKNLKKRRFWAWKFSNLLITQKPLDVQSWNLNTIWVLINALCKPSLGAPGHVTKILLATSGQKVDKFDPIYLDLITDIDEKWFAIFELTINHLSLGYVRLPQLEYNFSCFASFFFFFCRYLLLNRLNALYSKFDQLKISGRTFVQQKSGVPGWEDLPHRVLQILKLFDCSN